MSYFIEYDESLSKLLPWYDVPLGVLIDGTPFIYSMANHGLKSGLREENLSYTSPSTHCIISGNECSGKSNLCNNILSHLNNKDVMVKYFSKNIINKNISENIEHYNIETDLYYQLTIIENIMKRRNDASTQGYPGYFVDLKDGIIINDMYFDEKVYLKDEEGSLKELSVKEIKDLYLNELSGFKFLNFKDEESNYERWEEIDLNRTKFTGVYCMQPIVCVIDDYDIAHNDKTICKIEDKIQNIARLGRSAEIHLVLSSTSSVFSFPPSIRNNINQVFVTGGDVKQRYVKMVDGDLDIILMDDKVLSNSNNNLSQFKSYCRESIIPKPKRKLEIPEDLRYDYLEYLFK